MLGIGILVFNPLDDEYHLERIKTGLNSFIEAIKATKYEVKLFVLLNESVVESMNLTGVGKQTKDLIYDLTKKYNFIEVHSLSHENSMVKGYSYLLKHIHQNTNADYLSVFADDYIVPENWIDTILDEFSVYKSVDFIMPSTSYVTHKNLLVPFDEFDSWEIDIRAGRKVGVKRGVKIEEINAIATGFRKLRTIRYIPSASFETTVFTRNCIDKTGYICEDYYSIFWNTEYFQQLIKNGARGYISRKAFVFHYGKGGTTSLYQETGDEKYKGSPVEKNLINDVQLYNKRNNAHIGYWWRKESTDTEKTLSKEDIMNLVRLYDRWDKIYLKPFKFIKKILKKLYVHY